MLRWVSALVTAVLVSACVQQAAQLQTSVTFDPEEVAWAAKPGKNAVTGFAVLRTVGGEARTCAGLEVYLIPESTYARERMMGIYGNLTKASHIVGTRPRYADRDSQYMATSRKTRCDGTGNFSFENVPDGVWYVATAIVWQVPPNPTPQGGEMMERVQLRGGQSVKVVMP